MEYYLPVIYVPRAPVARCVVATNTYKTISKNPLLENDKAADIRPPVKRNNKRDDTNPLGL
jgi:hypothetical protein